MKKFEKKFLSSLKLVWSSCVVLALLLALWLHAPAVILNNFAGLDYCQMFALFYIFGVPALLVGGVCFYVGWKNARNKRSFKTALVAGLFVSLVSFLLVLEVPMAIRNGFNFEALVDLLVGGNNIFILPAVAGVGALGGALGFAAGKKKRR